MSEELKLLPCPFCGFKKPEISGNGAGDFYVICRDSEDDAADCCGGRSSDYRCEIKELAVERWNTRAVSTELASLKAEVEKLREREKWLEDRVNVLTNDAMRAKEALK